MRVVFNVFFRMANNGHTIIMSIHQPRYSIYQLFDNLTLLVSGKQVYHGPAHNALDYFANIGTLRNTHARKTHGAYKLIRGQSISTSKGDNIITIQQSGKAIHMVKFCHFLLWTVLKYEKIALKSPFGKISPFFFSRLALWWLTHTHTYTQTPPMLPNLCPQIIYNDL